MPKILLIEDDPDQILMYETEFRAHGFEIVSTRKGKEALGLAKKENPDLILLDIILPDLYGLDVLKQLKRDKETKDIPVILLTNLVKEEAAKRSIKQGAVDYLVKTHFPPRLVVARVKEVLKISH